VNNFNFIDVDPTGQIRGTGSMTVDELPAPPAGLARVVLDELAPSLGTHYWEGALVPMPAQPSPYHVFDWPTKAWVADLAAIRAAQRKAIEAQREALIYAPAIVYDGANLDADATSQRNITEKLNDIARREQESDPMPAPMLMWRDADNVDHTFADQAAYRSWLNGLAIALGLRGTQAYAWSWAKKAALEALGDDVAALLAFDATT
jgi:hypothetical protein